MHYAPMNFSYYFIHQWGFHDLHPHQCKVVSLDWRRHQLLVTTVPTKKKKRIRTTSAPAPAPTTNRRNLVLDPLTPVMSQKSRIWNFIFIFFCIMNRVVDGIERSTKKQQRDLWSIDLSATKPPSPLNWQTPTPQEMYIQSWHHTLIIKGKQRINYHCLV